MNQNIVKFDCILIDLCSAEESIDKTGKQMPSWAYVMRLYYV